MPSDRDVLDWLLEPSEPAMRYLASRDLLTPRPGTSVLARLRSEIPKRGWTAKIFARQKANKYWAKKSACYLPKFTATNGSRMRSSYGSTSIERRTAGTPHGLVANARCTTAFTFAIGTAS